VCDAPDRHTSGASQTLPQAPLSKWIQIDPPPVKVNRREGDPAILVGSSKKIMKELGWCPRYPHLEQIVETAWRWHKEHPYGFNKDKD